MEFRRIVFVVGHYSTLSLSGLYIAWNGRMMNWQGSGRDLIKLLFQHLSGGTEENRKHLTDNSRYPCRDSNQAHTKYKSRALHVYQRVRCSRIVIV